MPQMVMDKIKYTITPLEEDFQNNVDMVFVKQWEVDQFVNKTHQMQLGVLFVVASGWKISQLLRDWVL